MRIIFSLIAAVLAGTLVWLVIHGVQSGRVSPVDLKLLEIGSSFQSIAPSIDNEIEPAMSKAKETFEQRLAKANLFRFWGGVLEWIGISVTALLTFIAGFSGRAVSVGESPSQEQLEVALRELGKSKRKLAIMVGILASLAAVATLFGTELDSREQVAREEVRTMHERFHDARELWFEAKTESEVRQALREFEAIAIE